jgi:glyoxylase-like metal-dependent hydrolase (beta-lactamase superfamily II)
VVLVPPTVVNVGYRSTNIYVVSAGRSRLLVDLGWPGTFGTLRASLERRGVPLAELRYGLATHYHPDHAGLAQELKLAGVPLLVIVGQEPAIPLMKQWMKPQDRYVDITLHDNVTVAAEESRPLLAAIGIGGEIVRTPGHSDDSVSLLLDNGVVFTGDLPPVELATDDESAATVARSWRDLRERGATTVYPGHGPPRQVKRPANG